MAPPTNNRGGAAPKASDKPAAAAPKQSIVGSNKSEVINRRPSNTVNTIASTTSHNGRASISRPSNGPFQYEFGGPKLVACIILLLPLTVFYMVNACLDSRCGLAAGLKLTKPNAEMFNPEAFGWYICWFVFQAGLHLLPYGKTTLGQPLPNVKPEKRLVYHCNAFINYIVTLVLVAIAYFLCKIPLHRVYERSLTLSVAAMLFSFILSIYLYVRARKAPSDEVAAKGNSGNVIYDFWMGRELNPRNRSFDWKFFCELRPGLIGWVMLDLCMLAAEYQKHGVISPALGLLTLFHAWYVGDALWNEPAVLSTKDIKEEGFGFMLAFGDLAWVPFFYSAPAHYLTEVRPIVPIPVLVLAFALHCQGYWMFRMANNQKNWFRTNPKDPRVVHLETLKNNGMWAKKHDILCGGWWGWARHPNYTGDLLMAAAWTLACGFTGIYPAIYCIYFFILLVHRERRDDEDCHEKYGKLWEEYRSKVPYRFLPHIY